MREENENIKIAFESTKDKMERQGKEKMKNEVVLSGSIQNCSDSTVSR